MTVEARLQELAIVLPTPAAALANYVGRVRTGALMVVSGQLPLADGKLDPRHTGKLGAEVTPQAGAEAARLAAINVLAQAKAELGSLDKIKRVVRLGGYIAAAPGFTALPAVMNGASDLMVDVFGDKGRHARTTIGVAGLPLDAAVEVEAMFEIET